MLAILVACPFTAPFCAWKPSSATAQAVLGRIAAAGPTMADAGRTNPLICITVSDAEDPLKESDFKEFKDDALPEVRDTAAVAHGPETRRVCEAYSGPVSHQVAAILRV